MASRTIARIGGLLALTLIATTGCHDRTAEPAPPTAAQSGSVAVKPTQTGYADVGGARFYYQIYGDLASAKTPLLVLHGSFMSADAMAPLIAPFAATRPVIALDARGHGRTGDLSGPISYAQLADDAAGVLSALKVGRADVMGYSLGGVTALTLAVRHPDKVAKLVILSGTSRRDGWAPEVTAALSKATPEQFAGTPLVSEFKRLSPTPDAFPSVVAKLRVLDTSDYDISDDAIRAIGGKTMIVVGDTDAVELEHAIKLFRLRGGGDRQAILQGFLPASPRARLAVLPGTAHTGIMASADLIGTIVTPFLDDAKPIVPPGFFKDPGQTQ